jgi:hypothetical protein
LVLFETGKVQTPYRCSTRRYRRPVAIRKHHPANPWAWDTSVIGVAMEKNDRVLQGHCDGYHLTSHTDFLLNP